MKIIMVIVLAVFFISCQSEEPPNTDKSKNIVSYSSLADTSLDKNDYIIVEIRYFHSDTSLWIDGGDLYDGGFNYIEIDTAAVAGSFELVDTNKFPKYTYKYRAVVNNQ